MKKFTYSKGKKRAGSETALEGGPASKKPRTITLDEVKALGGPSAFQDSHIHPLGVETIGNIYLNSDTKSRTRENGLGDIAILFDDLILLMLQFFDVPTLCRLGQSSKALYAFVDVDTLWKEICLDKYLGDFKFQGTWRSTVAFHFYNKIPEIVEPRVQVKGLYSDTLYHAWFNAQVDPWRWAAKDTIPVRENLSLEEFIEEYEKPSKPVVIRGVVDKWPSFKNWSREYLIEKYRDKPFKTDLQASMPLVDYFKYCAEVKEEGPIYLFDNLFADRNPEMRNDYEVPIYFQEDFFSLIPGKDRPSYRWMLVGPPRSGATFHKDPNHTSAWNALLRGKKKWIMFHPDFAPNGVVPSVDGMIVSTPETLVQWFTDFYHQKHSSPAFEFIQRPGDLVFIPSGWWHSVLNLEESIAVTQNFVSERNLKNVYRFLKHKPSQELFNVFVENLRKSRADLLTVIEQEIDAEEKSQEGLQSMEWTALVGDDNGEEWKLTF